MKSVTIQTARTRLDTLLRLVAKGEEIRITEKNKTLARLVPPADVEVDWESRFSELDKIWGTKPLPGKPGSKLVSEGRR